MGVSDAEKSSNEGKEPKEPKIHVSQEQASVAADWFGFHISIFCIFSYASTWIIGLKSTGTPYMCGIQHFIPPYDTPPHPYFATWGHIQEIVEVLERLMEENKRKFEKAQRREALEREKQEFALSLK